MKRLRNGFAAVVAAGVLSMALAPSAASAAHGAGKAACRADVEKLCPDAKPGGGEIRKCLHEHKDELSDACKQAMAHRREHRHEKSGEAPAAATPEEGAQ